MDGKVTLRIPTNITDLTNTIIIAHIIHAGGSITINSFKIDYVDGTLLQYIQNLLQQDTMDMEEEQMNLLFKNGYEIKPVQSGNAFDYEFIDMCNNVVYDQVQDYVMEYITLNLLKILIYILQY